MSLDLSPAPGAAPLARQVRAQASMEVRLLLRNGEQLLLASRQPSVRRLPAPREPQALAQRVDVQRVRVHGGDVPQHLHRVHAAPRAALLEHHADPWEQCLALDPRVQPQHAYVARLRPPVPLAGLKRRGLPGGVRAEHGSDGAAVDRQVETVHGDHVAVRHAESPDRDSG
jgi:hypothetical protein